MAGFIRLLIAGKSAEKEKGQGKGESDTVFTLYFLRNYIGNICIAENNHPAGRLFLKKIQRRKNMEKRYVKIIFLVVLMAVSCGFIFAEGSPEKDKMMTTSVMVKTAGGTGDFLTDSTGMTLYYFTRDTVNKSVCAGNCVVNWPLFYSETITVPASLKASEFGTITRDDGKKQTTFRGYPLYYYIGDKKPGDLTGEGVGSVWYIIDPAKFMM